MHHSPDMSGTTGAISPGRRALLICNGQMADALIITALAARADLVVCADGGANAAHALGLTPDLVIGDFDSIRDDVLAAYRATGVRCERLARQDDTDFEKALLALRARGVGEVDIVGATGGLLDHALGNLSILLRYVGGMRVMLVDPDYRIDVITASARFSSVPDERISIVPLLASSGVTLSGLRYALYDAWLSPGVLEGTCNQAMGDHFEVQLRDGVLMVFRALDPAAGGKLPEAPGPVEPRG
jgi:thiamine pyrophosphokinase